MHEALRLLGELNDDDLEWMLEAGHESTFDAGSEIIAEETDPEHLYIVLSGLVGIRVAAVGATTLARLGPGELLGEISFLEAVPASATAAAMESTTVLAIPRATLATRLESDAPFGARFYKALALLGARRLRERVGALGTRLTAGPDEGGEGLARLAPTLTRTFDEFKGLLLRAGEEGKDPEKDPASTLAPAARGLFAAMLRPLNELLGDQGPGGPEWREAMGRQVQKEFLPYVLLSRFGERCFTKPRGYAGDYFTIEWMYRNDVAGKGPVGELVDAAILDAQPCRAVRNRRGVLATVIRETLDRKGDGKARVASFACGPAEEVFDVLEEMDDPSRLEMSLVDIDWEALGYVSSRLEKAGRTKNVKLHHANLVYLATGKETLPLEDLDLVYSIGLIDYFEDRFVVALLNYAYDVLAEGGSVILGNFHPRNLGRAFMDHVLDWKLIYRTEEDMNRIFAASRFGRPCERIRYEEERVNMFAEGVKS
jgi:extracellular factor (EF) 3-hydroxypalmitic acid methyl ester biosynthesis protein